MNTDDYHLVLFSGLAADETVFLPQLRAFPNLIVPRWLVPEPGETLSKYCGRLSVELPSDKPLVIGGASFGGIVALHVAQHVDARAVILLGSVKHPAELPAIASVARPFAALIRFMPVRLLQLLCAPMATPLAKRKLPHLSGVARQFARACPNVFKWSMAQILYWKESPRIDCPVSHLHGQYDRILPAKHTTPCETIPGAGHVITLTHPAKVNSFIEREISKHFASSNRE